MKRLIVLFFVLFNLNSFSQQIELPLMQLVLNQDKNILKLVEYDSLNNGYVPATDICKTVYYIQNPTSKTYTYSEIYNTWDLIGNSNQCASCIYIELKNYTIPTYFFVRYHHSHIDSITFSYFCDKTKFPISFPTQFFESHARFEFIQLHPDNNLIAEYKVHKPRYSEENYDYFFFISPKSFIKINKNIVCSKNKIIKTKTHIIIEECEFVNRSLFYNNKITQPVLPVEPIFNPIPKPIIPLPIPIIPKIPILKPIISKPVIPISKSKLNAKQLITIKNQLLSIKEKLNEIENKLNQ